MREIRIVQQNTNEWTNGKAPNCGIVEEVVDGKVVNATIATGVESLVDIVREYAKNRFVTPDGEVPNIRPLVTFDNTNN